YLLPDFQRMLELFEILRTRRDQRGSIDFDLPEAEVMLGESGDIEAIRPSARNVAHRIIEEFMLAANEVVARELVFANQPGIYRVHQQPDPQKLTDLKEILKEFRLTLRGDLEDIRPAELQRVLRTVAGDYWRYHGRSHRMIGESSHRELRLGDHVKVRVESIDEDRHQLEFRLLEVSGAPIKERER